MSNELSDMARSLANKIESFRTPWPNRTQVEGLIYAHLEEAQRASSHACVAWVSDNCGTAIAARMTREVARCVRTAIASHAAVPTLCPQCLRSSEAQEPDGGCKCRSPMCGWCSAHADKITRPERQPCGHDWHDRVPTCLRCNEAEILKLRAATLAAGAGKP